MPPQIELEQVTAVILGSFNPAIFQPAWFARNEVFGDDMRETAEQHMAIVHPDVTAFEADWLAVQVERNRCQLSTMKSSFGASLRDVAISVFTLLSHTPVTAVGINRDAHYRVDGQAEMNSLGYKLAPKDPWTDILMEPAMRQLVVEEARTSPKGYLRVQVAPSARFAFGIYIGVNDNYDLSDEKGAVDGTAVTALIVEEWEESLSRSESIADKVLELI